MLAARVIPDPAGLLNPNIRRLDHWRPAGDVGSDFGVADIAAALALFGSGPRPCVDFDHVDERGRGRIPFASRMLQIISWLSLRRVLVRAC